MRPTWTCLISFTLSRSTTDKVLDARLLTKRDLRIAPELDPVRVFADLYGAQKLVIVQLIDRDVSRPRRRCKELGAVGCDAQTVVHGVG